MALPIDPELSDEMFPGTLVEPFVLSEEVADLAADVIAKWDEFRGLRDALDSEAHPLQVAYVLDTKKFDMAEDEWTVHTVVNVTKASPLWRVLSGQHVALAYRQVFWDAQTEDEKLGFLHHGLSHIEALGGKVAIRPHPVEGFPWTFRRYGPLSLEDKMFFRAGSLWNEDHPSEPTQLRIAEVIDRVVDEVNAGALDGPGVKATASRSTTRPRSQAQAAARPASAPTTDEARAAAVVDQARAETNGVDTRVCVGSNHIPGCEHLGDVPKRDQA